MLLRLFIADLKMIVRNKQSLFWALVFPIIFATIFGLFRFDDIGSADVAVIADRPAAAQPFVRAVDAAEPLKLTTGYATVAEATKGLEDGDLDFVIVVGDRGAINLLFDETAADRNAVFLPVVRQIVDELNLAASGVPPAYRLSVSGVAGVSVKYYDFVLPGLVGMAVMTYGIIGLGGTLAQYRGQQILRRILATPLRPRMFISAIVLAHLVLAVVQSIIVLAFGVFVFGGSVRGSVPAILAIVVLGNITFLNIGFMVAARVDTAEAASGMGNAISMPMMFFSGVFFPTAGLPWILPTLTAILPLHPMLQAIRAISIDGASITTLGPELAQLVGWAVGTFLIASRVFRFEKV